MLRHVAVATATLAATGGLLWQQGRVLWCKCGAWTPWSGEIWSSHNSQHLADPYSFTHVLHGFAFFGLLSLTKRWLSLPTRLVVAVVIESGWELLENSEMVIQKYREATISLDYFGDSVANSLSDVVMCAIGFLITSRMRPAVAVALFIVIELVLAAWIRDGLLLNLLMLIHPVEAVKQWQMAGAPP